MIEENSVPMTAQYVTVPSPDTEVGYDVVRYDLFVKRLLKADTHQLMCLHASLGICGEAGELADAIKKEHIYGKVADRENIIEELGDLRFYMQAIQNLYGITEGQVLQRNATKLATRYTKLTFDPQAAIDRADKVGLGSLPDLPKL